MPCTATLPSQALHFPPRDVAYALAWGRNVRDPLGRVKVTFHGGLRADDEPGEMVIVSTPAARFELRPDEFGDTPGVMLSWRNAGEWMNHEVWAPNLPTALAMIRPMDPRTVRAVFRQAEAELMALTG